MNATWMIEWLRSRMGQHVHLQVEGVAPQVSGIVTSINEAEGNVVLCQVNETESMEACVALESIRVCGILTRNEVQQAMFDKHVRQLASWGDAQTEAVKESMRRMGIVVPEPGDSNDA